MIGLLIADFARRHQQESANENFAILLVVMPAVFVWVLWYNQRRRK